MRPLFLAAARPMNVEWKIRPYFGVFPLVFSALDLGNKLMANYTLKHHALKKKKNLNSTQDTVATQATNYTATTSQSPGVAAQTWGLAREREWDHFWCV